MITEFFLQGCPKSKNNLWRHLFDMPVLIFFICKWQKNQHSLAKNLQYKQDHNNKNLLAHSTENSRFSIILGLKLYHWKPVSLHISHSCFPTYSVSQITKASKIAINSSYLYPPMYKLIEKGYLPNISGLIWLTHISLSQLLWMGGLSMLIWTSPGLFMLPLRQASFPRAIQGEMR